MRRNSSIYSRPRGGCWALLVLGPRGGYWAPQWLVVTIAFVAWSRNWVFFESQPKGGTPSLGLGLGPSPTLHVCANLNHDSMSQLVLGLLESIPTHFGTAIRL